jgi:hypothetical protein
MLSIVHQDFVEIRQLVSIEKVYKSVGKVIGMIDFAWESTTKLLVYKNPVVND